MTALAGLTLQFTHSSFTDQLVQHSSQGIGIGVEILPQFGQGGAGVLAQIGLQLLQDHRAIEK